jgi:RNA polymerase sigma factor (sigma-70 family)
MHPVRSSTSSAAPQRDPAADAEPLLIATVEGDAPLPAETPLERAFETFLRPLLPKAMAHAEYFIGYDAADDAVQRATIEIWNLWTKTLPEYRTPGWFLQKVHLRVLNELERRKPIVELTEELEDDADFPRVISVSEATAKKDLERWVDRMIDGMPPMRRHVYILVRELRFPYELAAEMLGISVPSVHTHLQKTRAYFLKGLKRADVELTSETIMKLLPPKTETSYE